MQILHISFLFILVYFECALKSGMLHYTLPFPSSPLLNQGQITIPPSPCVIFSTMPLAAWLDGSMLRTACAATKGGLRFYLTQTWYQSCSNTEAFPVNTQQRTWIWLFVSESAGEERWTAVWSQLLLYGEQHFHKTFRFILPTYPDFGCS